MDICLASRDNSLPFVSSIPSLCSRSVSDPPHKASFRVLLTLNTTTPVAPRSGQKTTARYHALSRKPLDFRHETTTKSPQGRFVDITPLEPSLDRQQQSEFTPYDLRSLYLSRRHELSTGPCSLLARGGQPDPTRSRLPIGLTHKHCVSSRFRTRAPVFDARTASRNFYLNRAFSRHRLPPWRTYLKHRQPQAT